MDNQKMILIIDDNSTSFKSMTREQLDNSKIISVSQDDLKDNRVIAYITSCEFKTLVLKIYNGIIAPIVKEIMCYIDKIQVSNEGEQTQQLLNLMIELFPEKEGELRRAYMCQHNIMNV